MSNNVNIRLSMFLKYTLRNVCSTIYGFILWALAENFPSGRTNIITIPYFLLHFFHYKFILNTSFETEDKQSVSMFITVMNIFNSIPSAIFVDTHSTMLHPSHTN